MEIYTRNLANIQQLTGICTLENRGEMNERSRARSGFHSEGSNEEVLCPKPRRMPHISYPNADTLKLPLKSRSHSGIRADTEAGFEILNIFLNKGGLGESPNSAFSPPYSPPCRSSNPLVHDVEFVHQRFKSSPSILFHSNSHGSSSSSSSSSSASSSSSRGGNPLVRIEGFTFSGTDLCYRVSAQA